MQPNTNDSSPDIMDYIDSLWKELPEEMQTESMKEKLILEAQDTVMRVVSDSMSPDDLKETAELNGTLGIPMGNVIVTYLQDHPEVMEIVTEELNRFSELVLNFAQPNEQPTL